MSFQPPRNSYGGGLSRYLTYEVVGDPKNDPEQSGRVQCKAVGYEDTIPDSEAQWCRPMGSTDNPLNGGIGTSVVGAKKGTFFYGFASEAGQQPQLMGTLAKAGDKKGEGDGKLDPSGRNHDFPRQARDEKVAGGDDFWDGQKQDYRGKPVLAYAKDEAESPYGEKESKFGSEDEQKDYTIGAVA